MATDRALAHAYRQINGQLQYQKDHELAQELSDLCKELVEMIQDERLQWQLWRRKEVERWVVVNEGSNDPETVIAKAKGGLAQDGTFLVGPSTWEGYLYGPGEHFDTPEEAQETAQAERDRRIKDLERSVKHSTERLEAARARTVEVSDKVWEYGEWGEDDE